MHPYLFFHNYLTPALPYARARHKRAKAAEVLREWLRSANRRRERRKLIAKLEAMDDLLLRDIGIYRAEIPRVVDGLDDRELLMKPIALSAAPPVEIHEDSHRKAA